MQLIVVWQMVSNDGTTRNFETYECDQWEVIGSLLVLYRNDEAVRHIPLINIKSFYEQEAA